MATPTSASTSTSDDKNSTKTTATNATTETDLRGLEHVPEHLRIEIVYQDEDIIVVHKPCNLRSVPGNAEPPPPTPATTTTTGKRKHRDGPSPQEAWVQAIQQLAEKDTTTQDDDTNDGKDEMQTWLERLGGKESIRASIPRKYSAFARYIERSRHRIFGYNNAPDDESLKEITRQIFQRIECLQKQILQQPTPTLDEESVVGQCKLLGLANRSSSRANQDLFAVHRLDCHTSGLLVLARTATAASVLSACWRTRNQVHKTYRACVEDWPPCRRDENPIEEGEISLPMSPHPTERLKWIVDEVNGKESLTRWKVLEKRTDNRAVVLQLTPITGRTHQLRVHCRATGGSIRGDALYGTRGDDDVLYLHAEKLSFPHPTTKEIVSFEVPPKWQ